MYTFFGKGSLYDLWEDFIVYRNLEPADARLPGVSTLRKRLKLRSPHLPRKSDPDYALVVAEQLRQARRLDLPKANIRRLLFLGDTRLLDSTAFENLRQAGGWLGWAFIGRDDMAAAPQNLVEGNLFVSNRWSALPDFLEFVQQQGFEFDEQTALVIDMDKTAVGARGRNDRAVDEARLEGVRLTVANLLGEDFDEAYFRQVYSELNRPAYHPFTADNQDYLAYICLMLGTELFDFAKLIEEVRDGSLRSFADFIQRVHSRRDQLKASGLAQIHAEVWERFQQGDPTPFKAFRYNEYHTTAARFGGELSDPVSEALMRNILITQEVKQVAEQLRQQGVLIFGLSDKPDEASFPTPELAQAGMQPLHRLQTLCVGQSQ